MKNQILELSKKFISIKSNADNPKALNSILELALSELKDFTIERFERNGVKSALIYNTKKRPKNFKILLNGHLDVIPGKDFQYKPKVIGDKLYGVGSMDMKGNAACLIAVFKDVAKVVNYPIALQLVTDEEIGGFDGTKYQVEKGVRADLVLAGEPTNFDIVHQAKGILWIKIQTKGKTAHGAYPWRGENAVWKMQEFLNKLQKEFPVPKEQSWITTVNLSQIKTQNEVFNKIPDECTVGLDVRYIAEDKHSVLKKIKKLVPQGTKIEIIAKEPAMFTERQDVYLQKLSIISEEVLGKKVVFRGAQGSSDARHFERVNSSCVEFGPIGQGIGSDKEWVSISSLEKYYKIIKTFLLSIS